MDKNQSIGLMLLLALLMGWFYITAPTAEQIEQEKLKQDSIAQSLLVNKSANQVADIEEDIFVADEVVSPIEVDTTQADNSLDNADAKPVSAQDYTLKNDKVTVTFSNKGGMINEVLLHDHKKIAVDDDNQEVKIPLKLMDDPKNVFEYILPLKNKGSLSTKKILFDTKVDGQTITFTGNLGGGAKFIQKYTLNDGYAIDYSVETENLNSIVTSETKTLEFNWEQYLDRLEKNTNFEKFYATVYFKSPTEDSDYCNCRSDDIEEVDQDKIKWISHNNQFFNTSIIATGQLFNGGKFETVMMDDSDERMKLTKSRSNLDLINGDVSYNFQIYAGPNEFETLEAYGVGLEEIIPFGRSIFGTINRWVIRPSFNFLSKYIGSKGLVIIVMIFIIKMLLYPLTYKMLQSQAKMQALKPRLGHLKEKFKDEPQKIQLETMSIYREYGVSPLGGCMPMVLQMPIWYALFRFFPASITFRQEPFLWATDLSSYDVFATLPFTIPAFGSHISMFTVLWAVSTVAYTYYNTKHMDMSANPAMKYVQYLMPLMFLVFFNNYASGLTCYMFFSNLFNIMQTVVTKQFVFDDEKILAGLEKKKKVVSSKPKTGFQARLQEAMKQQQEIAAKKQQSKGKK
jgi:YidC/Oxa1 family membrane protein insertase